MTWGSHQLSGVACNLKSKGFAALTKSIEEVKGEAKPFSITGSLPLVKELQEAGFGTKEHTHTTRACVLLLLILLFHSTSHHHTNNRPPDHGFRPLLHLPR